MATPCYHRILFPTDFSDDSLVALPHAVGIATCHHSGIHLLHVLHEPVMLLPEAGLAAATVLADEPERLESAHNALERIPITEETLAVERVVLHGSAADEVCRYAADAGCDLIVMGTHGRTGLAHVLLGSTAERIVRHAPCPVMTVRPPRRTSAS